MKRITHRRGFADDAEHQFRRRVRRHDVRRDASLDETDGVMRSPEQRVLRQLHTAEHHQRVEQFVDGRLTQLGERGMRCPSLRLQTHAQDAARGGTQPVVGRLAVDQEPDAFGSALVGHTGAVTATFLTDNEQQAETGFASSAATVRRQPPARQECPSRRTRLVRKSGRVRTGSERTAARSRNAWRRRPVAAPTRLRKDVEAAVGHRLLGDPVAQRRQRAGEPFAGLALSPRRRIDVDQRPGQLNGVERVIATGSTARVRSARPSSHRDTSR